MLWSKSSWELHPGLWRTLKRLWKVSMDWPKASCAFYSETTDCAGNGGPGDVIYLDYSKAFNLIFHILIVFGKSNLVNILDVSTVCSKMTALPGSKSSGQWFEIPLVASYEWHFPGISTALMRFPISNDLEFEMSVPKPNSNRGGRSVCRMEGRAAFWRDLNVPEKRTATNSMKFGQKNRWVPHLMQKQPMQKHSLGAGWLESSFAENELEVLRPNKLKRSRQCASAAMRVNDVPGFISRIIAGRLREMVISSILPFYERLGSITSGLGLSSMRKTLTSWRESRGASTKVVSGQKHTACEGRLRQLHSFNPERWRLKGHFPF